MADSLATRLSSTDADYPSLSLSTPRLLTLLVLLVAAGFWLALSSGSVTLQSGEVWQALIGESPSLHQALVTELRLPRAVSAFTTGALLALAGVLMQVLLRNPLADPYILGTSGGAAVGTLLLILFGVSGAWLTLGAFAGAMASTLLVFGLAYGRGQWTPTRLLLTGVVVAAGWGAIISFILSISPNQNLRGMLFWLMGDLGYTTHPWMGLAALLLGGGITAIIARSLGILSRGELQAQALGVAVVPLRRLIYLLAAFLTATAVANAGSVGFVGLIVPHFMRLLGARDHRVLLPASLLAGGALLLFTDTIARTLIAPQQLPVGVITALIGVPLFLLLLQRASHHLPGEQS